MGIKYRHEIDGLRTIAVLSVIIYHAEFKFFGEKLLSGGFLGVDIFFVISGFLITSLMISEYQQTGMISIANFYQRRARRILPALFTVIFVSLPFAWLYLLPSQLIDYAKSLISSILFSSNFYWDFSLQQYGAESSQLKPFLHTWSLAVEEQYYIVFPLMLFVIYRWFKSATIFIFAVGLVVSLLFAQWMTSKDASFSFYMLPSRFWELLSGGLLAHFTYTNTEQSNCSQLNKTMPLLGVCLILYSVFFVDFSSSEHPGVITLLPVVGTMFIIGYANNKDVVTRILSSKPFVLIGLISYSLYLWHYPIFAFFSMKGLLEQELGSVAAIVLTFALSVVSYKYVETLFRSPLIIRNKLFALGLTSVAIVICVASYFVIEQNGFPSRMEGNLAASIEEMEAYRGKYWGDRSAYTNISDFRNNEISIEVIGNSWGQDIANALVEKTGYQVSFRGSTGHLCLAFTLPRLSTSDKKYQRWKERCAKNVGRFETELTNTDVVILADNKTLFDVDNELVRSEFLKNLKILRNYGYSGPVLIIANRPTYKKKVFEIFHEFGVKGDGVNAYAQRYLMYSPAELKKQDAIAKRFYDQDGVYYFSLVELLCDSYGCKVSDDGRPLYHDTGHLTLSGAQYISHGLSEYINNEILGSSQQHLLSLKAMP